MVLLEEKKEEKRTFPALGPQTGQRCADGLSLYRILSRQDKDEKNILNLQTASPRL